jgi:hypothetical protein
MADKIKSRPAFNGALVCAGLLLAMTSSAAVAQQEPKQANPPNAPPSDQAQPNSSDKPQSMPAPLESTLKLLAKRSIFFPDLAADKRALTPLQKLELATDNSVAPSMVLGDLISAGIDQATNSLQGYGQEYAGFGKRFGSALATSTTNQYFKTFLLPTLLHEDPRYFVRLHGTTATRVLYAVTRVVVTQTDAKKHDVNWSGIVGPLMAEGLANTYLPPEQRTAGKTFRRYGIRIGVGAAANIVKEYWPTFFSRLRITDTSTSTEQSP